MILIFGNRKPFFEFEHLILKSTDPTRTSPGPDQDIAEIMLGSCQDLTRHQWDLVETFLETDSDSAKDLIGTLLGHHWDLTTWLGPSRDIFII